MPRGPDTVWHVQCRACHELAADQLELAEDRPGGVAIQIWRCRRCAATRSCRAGWTTRCHVCLDERSTSPWVLAAGQAQLAALERDRGLAAQARQLLGLAPDLAIPARSAAETSSYLTLADQLRSRERPGWTILATDIKGLPWHGGTRTGSSSHGTWARHDPCGAVTRLRVGTTDCPSCGPQPGSRTHQARSGDPYLLYLVRTRRWQKFGVGDERRVRTHLRNGATVVQVLRAPFAHVVLAEKTLKQHHTAVIAGRPRRGMITSFGQRTEVARHRVTINLAEVLPDGEDVTSMFL